MIRLTPTLSTRISLLVNKVRQQIHPLLRTLTPTELCVCCLAPAHRQGLCQGCLEDLPVSPQQCHRCALPLTFGVRRGSDTPTGGGRHSRLTCGHCIKQPPPFDHTFALWRYQFPVDRLISGYKYEGKRAFGRPLLAAFSGAVARELSGGALTPPDLLLPAPMHRARQRQRGFNQAEEIAEAISLRTGIPWSDSHLRKVRATKSQRTLNRRQRLQNLKNAFSIIGPLPARVALVDDVMTTGATMNTLASLLKAQGVDEVQVWVMARTPE